VDETKVAGVYEARFDAATLASGCISAFFKRRQL